MKKIACIIGLISSQAMAAPWDLSVGQYDQFGTSILNRLVPLPSGSVSGIVVYDVNTNLPKLAKVDSSLTISTANPPVISAVASAPTWASITGTPPPVSTFSNDSGYLTGITSGQVTTALGFTPGTGTVTSITAGTGLSGGVITTSGTISMPNTGTAATYSGNITTDAQGRVTAGTNRSQSAQTRTLNSGFQISSTRDALAFYSVQMTVTASIGGGQDGDVFLDIASDSGFTTNLQTLAVGPCSQTYTLAISLQGVQKCSLTVSGYVPAAYYTRLRTVNNTGTPAYLYRYGQEVLL
jgi:hypothetical protein